MAAKTLPRATPDAGICSSRIPLRFSVQEVAKRLRHREQNHTQLYCDAASDSRGVELQSVSGPEGIELLPVNCALGWNPSRTSE